MTNITVIEQTAASKLKVAVSFSLTIKFDYPIYALAPRDPQDPDAPLVHLVGQELLDFVQAYGDQYVDDYLNINPQIVNRPRVGPANIVIFNTDPETNIHTVRILIDADYLFEQTLYSDKFGEELDTFLQEFANDFEAQFRLDNIYIVYNEE